MHKIFFTKFKFKKSEIIQFKIEDFKKFSQKIGSNAKSRDFTLLKGANFKISAKTSFDESYEAFLSIFLYCQQTEIKK